MTTSEARRYCLDCEERTRHEIEQNRETGWKRVRCQACSRVRVLSNHDPDAVGTSEAGP